MMSMDKDPSSVMDIVDVGGTFGGGRTGHFTIHWVWSQVKPFEGHNRL